RPLHEAERALAGRHVLLNDLGAGDIAWHEVGCELDAVELQVQGPGQGGYGQRLGQPRHADRQAVAAGEQADQHLFDHLLLTDDDLVNFAPQQFAGALHALHGLFGACPGGGGLGLGRHTNGSWSRIRSPKTASTPAAPGVGRGQPASPTASGPPSLSLRSLPWRATIRNLDHSYPSLFL